MRFRSRWATESRGVMAKGRDHGNGIDDHKERTEREARIRPTSWTAGLREDAQDELRLDAARISARGSLWRPWLNCS